jgi:hypothetical protein
MGQAVTAAVVEPNKRTKQDPRHNKAQTKKKKHRLLQLGPFFPAYLFFFWSWKVHSSSQEPPPLSPALPVHDRVPFFCFVVAH